MEPHGQSLFIVRLYFAYCFLERTIIQNSFPISVICKQCNRLLCQSPSNSPSFAFNSRNFEVIVGSSLMSHPCYYCMSCPLFNSYCLSSCHGTTSNRNGVNRHRFCKFFLCYFIYFVEIE